MIERFLKCFWNPLVQIIKPEYKSIEKKIDRMKRRDVSVLLEINKTQPYAVYFTPNGNYGDLIWLSYDIKGIREKTKHWSEPYYHCIYAELDRKDTKYRDNDEYWQHINFVIKTNNIPCSLVVETHWWFHLYWLIEEDSKERILEEVWDNIIKICSYITLFFDGGDVSSYARNKLFRLPDTNHRKTGEPVKTILYQYKDFDKSIEIDRKNIKKINIDNILSIQRYMDDSFSNNKVIDSIKRTIDSVVYSDVCSIKFEDIIKKLKDYPKIYLNKQYILSLANNNINIVYSDGEIKETDWYILNKSENYINCFSSSFYPIEERPRWPVIPFLWYYFEKDYKQVNNFLSKEFWLTIFDRIEAKEWEDIESTIIRDDYSIIFTNKRVKIQRLYENKKWESKIVETVIFNLPVKILWKSEMNIDENFMETDKKEYVYLASIFGNEFLLRKYSSKRKFNDNVKNVFFYAEDNDLGYFYEALEYCKELKKIETIIHSGVYKDFVYLWSNYIYWYPKKLHEIKLFDFPIYKWEQTSLYAIKDILLELRPDYIAIPALLQTVAMAGMNIWEWNSLSPSLLLTGKTKSGKTTLSEILKKWVWYQENSRRYALWSLTPQPIKEYATDNSILFLEEITSSVQDRCEDLIRNIINKDTWARGTSGGKNIQYKYKSPILAVGERTFKDESINNRFLILPMEKSQKMAEKSKLIDAKKYSITNDIYDTYIKNRVNIDANYKHRVSFLLWKWYEWRIADIWAYIFVVNDIFELYIPINDLLTYMSKNLDSAGYMDNDNADNPHMDFKGIVMQCLLKWQLRWFVSDSKWSTIYTLVIPDEFIQKNRVILHQIASKFEGRITITNNFINVEQRDINTEQIDTVIEMMMDFILQVGKNAFQYKRY